MASFTAYIAVSGRNSGVFVPAYVWLARVFNEQGQPVWSNDHEPPSFVDGHPHLGYFRAAKAALEQMTEGSTLTLSAKPNTPLAWPFGGELRTYHHRRAEGKRKGEEYADAAEIRKLDELAQQLKVTLTSRPPSGEEELELLAQTVDDVARRRDSAEDAAAMADDKFCGDA